VTPKAASHPNIAVWIMALGIAFSLALFLTAAFSEDPWRDHTYDRAAPIVAGMPAPHRDGREKMVCSSCHIVVAPKIATGPQSRALPIVKGTPSPHIDGRAKVACANCHRVVSKGSVPDGDNGAVVPSLPAAALSPQAVSVAMEVTSQNGIGHEIHEWLVPYRYQGKVLKIAGSGVQSVWGDVYVLVDDGINPPLWIDLGPRWFLQAAGCAVRSGMFVKGTAFRDPAQGSTALAYGQSVMTNGEVCTLRDNHLKGLWTEAGGTDAEER